MTIVIFHADELTYILLNQWVIVITMLLCIGSIKVIKYGLMRSKEIQEKRKKENNTGDKKKTPHEN